VRPILFLLCVLTWPAAAQSWDQAYFDARNTAGAELRGMAQQPEFNPSRDVGKPEMFTPAFRAEYDKRRREVEARLRDVLGPLPALAGFSGTGTLNPALCCYGRFGALDGLSFDAADGGRVIVSTEGLLRRWLAESKDFWTETTRPPSELPALFATPSFYRWTRASDWTAEKMVDLPIGLPEGARAVGALLATARPGANWIALSVAKTRRLYVAFVRSQTRMTSIGGCEQVAANAYRACWSQQAKTQPWYADLLLEALAVADRLPD
jgi:hypothetical protein